MCVCLSLSPSFIEEVEEGKSYSNGGVELGPQRKARQTLRRKERREESRNIKGISMVACLCQALFYLSFIHFVVVVQEFLLCINQCTSKKKKKKKKT